MISTHLGDCLDILPSIPNDSVDMVLCDLPYGTAGHKWYSLFSNSPSWEGKLVNKENG